MGGALNFEWIDWSLVAIAALQGLWLAVLLIWAARSHRLTSKGPLKRVRKAWSLSGAQKAELFKRTKEIEEAHQASVQVFLRQRSDALIVGALGLAAWSALMATGSGGPLHGPVVRLLLVGVAFNLAGPSLLRSGPSEGSFVCLQAFQVIGYSAITLAVISACAVVFREGWVTDVAELVGPMLVIIEAVQINNERVRVAQFLGRSSTQSGPVDPATA